MHACLSYKVFHFFKKHATELIFCTMVALFFLSYKTYPQNSCIQELYLLWVENKLHVSKSYNGNISMLKYATELNVCRTD